MQIRRNIRLCLLRETGTFWRSANIPITAHSLLQYVHISDSKSSGRHPPPCITTEEVFIASCHATHSRQRAILKPARVMLHNRAKASSRSDLCSLNVGILLPFVWKCFHAAARSRTWAQFSLRRRLLHKIHLITVFRVNNWLCGAKKQFKRQSEYTSVQKITPRDFDTNMLTM